MTKTIGCSVRLFLVDGHSSGLVTAEIMNWSGHVLAGSRTGLPEFLKRTELDRTGVYFLFGHDPDDLDMPMVYVGESDNVRNRLVQHNKDDAKGFWERTCVVTSKDQNITKAHARFLEARLIAIASDIGRAKLCNSTAPNSITLPEADTSDMEYFIEQIRLVLPVLGFDAFRAKPKRGQDFDGVSLNSNFDDDDHPIFELTISRRGLNATAQEVGGEFIVLAGSLASLNWRQEGGSYAKLHARLFVQGILAPDETSETAYFTEDTAFSSPSAASAVIAGRADNGRTTWRVKGKNMTYADWQEQRITDLR